MSRDLLRWVARLTWRDGGGGDEVPPDLIPSPADLAADLRGLPADADQHLQRAMDLAATPPALWQWVAREDGPVAIAAVREAGGTRLDERPLSAVHQLWRAIPDPRPPHPLAPIVAAWQARPRPASEFRPVRMGSLPRWHRLIDGGGGPAHELPSTGISGFPGWVDWMYSRVGGMATRHGAPWPLRLHVAALLHLSVADRDGRWHALRFPLADVEGWLHPDGWHNRRRDWHRLPAALNALHVLLSHMPVVGLGSVAVLVPSVIPDSPAAPLVEFTARCPRRAAHGARVDWPAMRRYGATSATLFRAYLSAMVLLDHAAHRGQAPTAEIGRPLLDAAGRPRRGKGGRIQRGAELVPSPAARFVRQLSDSDLARLAGFRGAHREYRRRGRAAFERLAADGVIDLRRERDGWRIYGPQACHSVSEGVS